ncbi:sensor histidine kinase [Pseudochelatococcus contaminans]|uniref:histidine kinase n=1 Tax=Pseudochelatococcus contaminans TaxID=1538103 RepID=A0A7W5Z500_9HYPH|nr:GAF domain-containing protein [Pseudochelatococcus contaminans]MBB3810193.1 two-component sensor histidine kinase [Pseudochelatococcus contaminans]
MGAGHASLLSPGIEPFHVGAVITHQLMTRPRRALDPREEVHALQDLAWQMLEQPDSFLTYLVDKALRISGAHSSGISLHEPDSPEGDVFRWHYVTGACKPFIGRTTPRQASPCGICIDEGGPILIAFPELICADYALPGIVNHEALLVPIYLAGDRPLGALWVISHDEDRQFDGVDARVLGELASFAGIALKMIRDKRALKEALEVQELLVREMRHRIGNILTVASGIVSASARTAATPQEMALKVRGRLEALGRAQGIVHQGASDHLVGHTFVSFSDQFRALVKVVAAPYSDGDDRIDLADTMLIPNDQPVLGQGSLTALGLVLHELATNAVKYGALSIPGGRVGIDCRFEGRDCVLSWREGGGPCLSAPPQNFGFGSTLIKRTILGQLEGAVQFDWQADGLVVEIRMNRQRLGQ